LPKQSTFLDFYGHEQLNTWITVT